MAAPSFLTFDGGTGDAGPELPRRPSTDDLGGDDKQDNNENPPDDVEHFTAGGWNQIVKVLSALARTAAACKIEVRFSGGAPVIQRVSALGSAITTATFTPTDNGMGDTTITWPADTFPPHVCSPTGLTLFSSSTNVVDGHVEEVTNGIRVRTKSGGAAADIPFTIEIN
jgi:hypothetical protein